LFSTSVVVARRSSEPTGNTSCRAIHASARLAQGELPGPSMSPNEVAAFLQAEHERYRKLMAGARASRQEGIRLPMK